MKAIASLGTVSLCVLACVLWLAPASLARVDSATSIPPWSTYQQPGASVMLDSAQRYAGMPTLRIAISAGEGPSPFMQARHASAVWLLDATPYRAKRVRLAGYIKAVGAVEANVWLRVDGSKTGALGRDSASKSPQLRGDHDWTSLEVSVDIPGDALAIAVADDVSGPGTIWGTYPQLQVVGPASPTVAGARPIGMLEGSRRTAVVNALRRDVTFLDTVEPTAPLDDLNAFDRDVGTARVIGLGDASAGSAEFLRMKHRLFRDLVERHGVTVLAFDTAVAEAREVDRYVATGRGDPNRALRALPTWHWQTAEVRDLVKWMRAFNAAPGLHPTLHFAGFDPASFGRAVSNVESFAAKQDPHVKQAVTTRYACMPRSMESWQRLSATRDGKPGCIRNVAEVSRLIATLHPDVDVAHDAHVVEQGVRVWLDPHGNGWGDLGVAQAENIAWLAATRYPGATIAVWSDNRAIGSQKDADRPADWPTLGARLSERFGKGYVRIGFAFDRGVVSATNDRLGPTRVAPAPSGTMEELLNSVGTRFYVPLRSLRAGDPAARWFDGETLGREIPSWFVDSSAALVFDRWKQRSRFDALIFVSESHASGVFPSLLGPLHYPAQKAKP